MNNDLFNKLKQIAENQGSPYKSVKLINDTLIVVLNDGNIVKKYDATEQDYYNVLKSKTKIEIKNKISVENNDIENQNYVSPITSYTMKKTIKSRINKIN